MVRVFANSPSSTPYPVITKTQNTVLMSPRKTQHYKVRTKGKSKNTGKKSRTFPYTSLW